MKIKVRKGAKIPQVFQRTGEHKNKKKYSRSQFKREGWDG